ncbi:MAG: lysylphosphatidylglycerol synthase transmembrane domain-containing protein [Planctomycetota bacterium]|nr:lysylphosphatidylglycerol synthase transmembrane domain-containing protein [Planctomycetota bacterium]
MAVLLKVAVGLVLLVLLLYKVDFHQFKERMKQVPLQSYLLGLFIYTGGMAVRTLRWKILLGATENPIGLGKLIRLQFIGTFFNQFLPSSVGGDGARVYFLCRHSVPWERGVGSVLVERIVGMLMLVLLGIVAAIAGYRLYQNNWIYLVLTALLCTLIGGILVLFSVRTAGLLLSILSWLRLTKLREITDQLLRSIRIYRAHPGALANVTLLSFAFQLIVIWLFYYFSLQLNMDLSIWYFVLFIPIVMSVSQIPLSLNGTGIREWTCTLLFTHVGAGEPQAVALAVCYWLLQVGPAILGGILFGLTSGVNILDDMRRAKEA